MKSKFLLLGSALMIAAALAVSTGPVLADPILPTNTEVWNGGFDQGALGWPRLSNTTIMTGQTIGGQAALAPTSSGAKGAYQIIDAAHLGDNANQYTQLNSLSQVTASMPANELGSANTDWIPGAASETYTFSYQYYISTAGGGSGQVRLYEYTGTGTPPYDVNSQSYNYVPLGVSSPNWTLLYDSGTLSTTSGTWVTVNVPMGTITGDPEYFGIVLNGNRGTGTLGFDSMSLVTQSAAPVPIPPSLLLLGSGLLGMGLVGVRRRKSHCLKPTEAG